MVYLCFIRDVKSVFVHFSRGVSVGQPICQLGLTVGQLCHGECESSQLGKKNVTSDLDDSSPDVVDEVERLVI